MAGSTVVGATVGEDDLEVQLERHRRELIAHSYRMLGSASEAEDAVQETFLRAWRSYDRFEGRSSLRTWLYRIATNVCLDMADGRQRRARPIDLGGPSTVATASLVERPNEAWVEPIADGQVLPSSGDPAELAVARDEIRLAFVATLQHLPPRQRAVLLLREVLRWRASEVAELLDTTVASVNSALQRARATLAEHGGALSGGPVVLDEEAQDLLARYVDAFERYDLDTLTALLHEDAIMSMPPYELWLRGADQVRGWLEGPGAECEGSRMVATRANGQPAFGQYRIDPAGGHAPWALQVLDLRDGRVTGLCSFLDVARLFPRFGLPGHLDP
jgi:RNA polymerase sigma-70 factor, ECF subfamily